MPADPRAAVLDQLESKLPERIARDMPAAAEAAQFLELLTSGLMFNSDRALVSRALSALVDAANAVWAASARRGAIPFSFDGRAYTGTAGPVNYACSTPYWIGSVVRALATRRRDGVDAALAFPVELIDSTAHAVGAPYQRAELLSLRGLLLSEPDVTATQIARAKELAAPAHASIGGPRFARCARTRLEMMEAIAARRQDAFTEASVHALEAHRSLSGRGRERSDATRYFAFAIIGLAALAIDRGMRWEIDCAYAPEWLVQGDAR